MVFLPPQSVLRVAVKMGPQGNPDHDPEPFGRKLNNRDDPHGFSECPVQMIECMCEPVVIQRSGFGPTVAEFAGGQIPDSAWGLQLVRRQLQWHFIS